VLLSLSFEGRNNRVAMTAHRRADVTTIIFFFVNLMEYLFCRGANLRKTSEKPVIFFSTTLKKEGTLK
jgi:hypothetical protein